MPHARTLAFSIFFTGLALIFCSESCKQPLEEYHAAAEAAEEEAAADASTGRSRASLWSLYYEGLQHANYIDLSHVLKPAAPIWKGFGHPQQFQPAKDPATGQVYSYSSSGFEATSYLLQSDQFGTQLDPPAHWAPHYPAIDEIPPTYAVRPLVVINVADKVAANAGYHLQAQDVLDWERQHGRVPTGSVVMVRSDWHKKWDDPNFASLAPFPGVGLKALQLLHLQRGILFHGHEPLDTDGTPTLEGEAWLLHNGYAQAEGVANLDQLPPTGCLISIGFPRFAGGTGGLARYVAICPPNWHHGVTVADTAGALLQHDKPLQWDTKLGYRVRA
ncbi:hypothetical protein OEZ86_010059 [Tetradesmus obliquus]|uniref:Cyclase n=1 Tax=Tetradesmus obliquus TaxID=3088 RepID=A0ABY8UPW4_TETOB|nr:hypothetical protein OEZ85_001494 [Tetradesmus obliquus]WIA43615.1 hypothetical protein OEZ86_010059 [Tetradesmus obliquus]